MLSCSQRVSWSWSQTTNRCGEKARPNVYPSPFIVVSVHRRACQLIKLCSENATFYRRQSVVYRQWHPVRTAGHIAAGSMIPLYSSSKTNSRTFPVNQTSSPSLYCHTFQYRKHTTCSTSTNYLGMWILPSQTIFLFLHTLRVKYQAFFQLLARFLSSDVQFPTFLYILEAKQAWEHEFWSLSNGHKTKARDKFVFWSQSQRHVRSGSSQTAQFARKGWRNCDPWTSVFSLDSIWVHFLKVLLWVKVPRQKPQGLWHLASRSYVKVKVAILIARSNEKMLLSTSKEHLCLLLPIPTNKLQQTSLLVCLGTQASCKAGSIPRYISLIRATNICRSLMLQYLITEHRVPELIPVLVSQPASDVSHKPGGRLPLLSTRPAITPATLKRTATSFAAWWTRGTMVWTVCLRLLPDSIATAIWTRGLLHLSPAC